MLRAAVFDMDGLLIDSEPLWQRVERRVFGELGLQLETEDCEQTTGLRVDEVVRHWHARRPWSEPTPEVVAQRIVDDVVQLVRVEGQGKPGYASAIRACLDAGLILALASSSPRALIDAVLARLDLVDTFSVTCTALDESHGKPHPAVYLTTAGKLGIEPQSCLAFEDSITGVIAAKSARMRCIAVPDLPFDRASTKLVPFGVADALLESLELVDRDLLLSLGELPS